MSKQNVLCFLRIFYDNVKNNCTFDVTHFAWEKTVINPNIKEGLAFSSSTYCKIFYFGDRQKWRIYIRNLYILWRLCIVAHARYASLSHKQNISTSRHELFIALPLPIYYFYTESFVSYAHLPRYSTRYKRQRMTDVLSTKILFVFFENI